MELGLLILVILLPLMLRSANRGALLFLLSDDYREERRLQALLLRLRGLQLLARAIGKTEREIEEITGERQLGPGGE